jgi:transcriptional regulator with XRE-family HTH domain
MEHEESRTIGQLLKADRVGKGLSQENYARELGMRRVYLAQIEEGHPKYPKKYIPAISAMLGISIPMLAQIAGVLTAEDELIHEVALHEEHARYTINGHADQLRSEATALIEHFDERQLRRGVTGVAYDRRNTRCGPPHGRGDAAYGVRASMTRRAVLLARQSLKKSPDSVSASPSRSTT